MKKFKSKPTTLDKNKMKKKLFELKVKVPGNSFKEYLLKIIGKIFKLIFFLRTNSAVEKAKKFLRKKDLNKLNIFK